MTWSIPPRKFCWTHLAKRRRSSGRCVMLRFQRYRHRTIEKAPMAREISPASRSAVFAIRSTNFVLFNLDLFLLAHLVHYQRSSAIPIGNHLIDWPPDCSGHSLISGCWQLFGEFWSRWHLLRIGLSLSQDTALSARENAQGFPGYFHAARLLDGWAETEEEAPFKGWLCKKLVLKIFKLLECRVAAVLLESSSSNAAKKHCEEHCKVSGVESEKLWKRLKMTKR